MTLDRTMALALIIGIVLGAAADEKENRLRRQTTSVRKIRRQTTIIDRGVQDIRALMETSGVISEEMLVSVKRISAEVDSAANQNLNKALVHIAEARDNIATVGPHIASAIKEEDAAEKSLKDAHREATVQAQVSLLVDLLTRLQEDLAVFQEEVRKTQDSTLAGNEVDSEVIAEKQHRLADQLDPAQEALTFLREEGEMPEAAPQDAGKRLDTAAHTIAQDLEDEQYPNALTGQTHLIAWIDRILNQLEEKQPQMQPQQQTVQNMIEQIQEQNQDIQEFQEQQQQDQQQQNQPQQQQLQEQQQQLSEQLQQMNLQQAQAETKKAQMEMEKGNMPKAQEHNEKAKELLEQTMAEMQAMQDLVQQVKEQNQDIQEFQEKGQQPTAENEEFNDIQAQQQELSQEMQDMNQQQAQAEAEKAQTEMENGNMPKAQEHNERAKELLEQAMAAAMGQEEMKDPKKEMPAPGPGDEEAEEKKEMAGGGESEEKKKIDLPNFQENELDTAEVFTGKGWTRELGEGEKTSMRQGAQAQGPKAYESLSDQYFEAMGAH